MLQSFCPITKVCALLFLLGFGYLVFAYASKQEKGLKSFGRLVGITIIATALFISISSLVCYFILCGMKTC